MGKGKPARVERKPDRGEKLFSITLADCDVQAFRAGGPGGQKQNKTSSAIRIVHPSSGATGESREQRSQLQNKKTAFRRMTEHPKFRIWLNREIWLRERGEPPEQKAARDMDPRNLLIMGRENGNWKIIG